MCLALLLSKYLGFLDIGMLTVMSPLVLFILYKLLVVKFVFYFQKKKEN